ncbi:MAG: HAD-IA family hydrolase [Polyangia bacterium]
MDHDLYVFDLDGTLLHTLPDITRALNAALVEVGRPVRTGAEVRSFLGEGARELVGKAASWPRTHEGLDALVERYRHHYRQALVIDTRPYPGVVETLARITAPIAVLTNKRGHEARVILEGAGLRGFAMVIGDGDGYPRKPDPTSLLHLCKDAKRPLYIGDSQVDAETARRAQVEFVFCDWGYGTSDHGRRVSRFEDVIP